MHALYRMLSPLVLITATAVVAQEPVVCNFNYETDMQAVQKILNQVWSKLFWLPTPDATMIRRIFVEHRGADFNNRHPVIIKVFKKEGTLIGFTTYYKPANGAAHIELFAIDPQFQGKGYGKKFLEGVLADLNKEKTSLIQLYVYTNNPDAIRFYQHAGFATKLQHPNYLLMQRVLTPTNKEVAYA